MGYSELNQPPKMELFVKMANGFQLLAIYAKHSILNVWQNFEYASDKIVQS